MNDYCDYQHNTTHATIPKKYITASFHETTNSIFNNLKKANSTGLNLDVSNYPLGESHYGSLFHE